MRLTLPSRQSDGQRCIVLLTIHDGLCMQLALMLACLDGCRFELVTRGVHCLLLIYSLVAWCAIPAQVPCKCLNALLLSPLYHLGLHLPWPLSAIYSPAVVKSTSQENKTQTLHRQPLLT